MGVLRKIGREKILVLGGTGFVGRHVCEKLIRAGLQVTVPARHSPHAKAVATLPGLTVLGASGHDPAALLAMVHGREAVVNLVTVLQGNEAAFDKAHLRLPDKLARACQVGGVRRLMRRSALVERALGILVPAAQAQGYGQTGPGSRYASPGRPSGSRTGLMA